MIKDSPDRFQKIRARKEKIYGNYLIGEIDKDKKYDVYLVPIELLLLNPRNSRFQSKIVVNIFDGNFARYYEPEGQQEISDWIFEWKKQKNLQTQKDIKEKGQQVPAIITADGLIINGNRRFAAMKKLFTSGVNDCQKYSKFKVVILNDVFSDNYEEIKKIEIKVQFGKDKEQGYKRIDTMLAIRDLNKTGNWTEEEIKNYFNWTKDQVRDSKLTLKYIDEYLSFCNLKNEYDLVDGAEDQFKHFAKSHDNIHKPSIKADWKPKTEDFENYKLILFKVLRSKPLPYLIKPLVRNSKVFWKNSVWDSFQYEVNKCYKKALIDARNYCQSQEKINGNKKCFENAFRSKIRKAMDLLLLVTANKLDSFKEKDDIKTSIQEIEKKAENIEKIISDSGNNITWKKQKKQIKKIIFRLTYVLNKMEK